MKKNPAMRIVSHEKFNDSNYARDNASLPGRMEAIHKELKRKYHYIDAVPVDEAYLLSGHSSQYIDTVKQDSDLYNMALLAAGGARIAAETGALGKPAFAAIRPPGHHAYREQGWGFCHFSNMALSLLHLKNKGFIKSAFLLDFDAHTGDGTIDVLKNEKDIFILNPMAEKNDIYKKVIEDYIKELPFVDIIAVCAGFDSYKLDLGRKLETFDFYYIGKTLSLFCKKLGHNKRYAALEGGYYLPDLGKNVLAFCEGFE